MRRSSISGLHAAARPAAAAATAAVVLALSGGAGWAHWTATGAGTGAGGTGSTVPVVLTPGVPTTELYPGTSAAVAVEIVNPGPGPVFVGSLALDEDAGTDGLDVDDAHDGCDLAALSFVGRTNGGAGWTVPAGGSLAVELVDALSLDAAASPACQGATFAVHLEAGL